jgi:multiple antibiotic resistance protein
MEQSKALGVHTGSAADVTRRIGLSGATRAVRTTGAPVRLASSLGITVVCLVAATTAFAEVATATQVPTMSFPIAHIFTLLFIMLGPFKIIGPFVKATKGAETKLMRKIALLAIAFSCAALLFAGLLGEGILKRYGIPLPILALAGGIILFLVALQGTIKQFSNDPPAPEPVMPTLDTAIRPLAFPVIVTPYGIATLIFFLSFAPDTQTQLKIAALVVAIMALNLLVMLVAKKIPPMLGAAFAVLGAVLNVIQVALGLQIISKSLTALGLL